MILCGLLNGLKKVSSVKNIAQDAIKNPEEAVKNAGKLGANAVKNAVKHAAISAIASLVSTIIGTIGPILIVLLIIVILTLFILGGFSLFMGSDSDSGDALPYNSDYVVKTDEANAAPVPSASRLREGIKSWLSNNNEAQKNALSVVADIVEMEKEYHVNPVFIYALMWDESSMGTANTSWVRENNWCSLTGLGHIQYTSPGENIKKMADLIANGSYYFTQGRYTVYSIGEVYCADPPPPAWADNVSGFMTDFYLAMGYTYGETTNGSGVVNSEIGTFDGTWYYSAGTRWPWYKQGYFDKSVPWYSVKFGAYGKTIHSSGCGCITMSVIATGLTGQIITPDINVKNLNSYYPDKSYYVPRWWT